MVGITIHCTIRIRYVKIPNLMGLYSLLSIFITNYQPGLMLGSSRHQTQYKSLELAILKLLYTLCKCLFLRPDLFLASTAVTIKDF